jgi:hypothetical protein
MSSLRPIAAVVATSLVACAFACGSPVDRGIAEDEVKTAPESSSGGDSPMLGSSGGSSSGASGGNTTCAATAAVTEKAKVDIIFVIDDSGSMTAEMNQIRTNVNTFASKIGGIGLDYTVTFIVKKATSPTQTGNVICVPPPLAGANCADKAPTFHHVNQDVQSTDSLQLILSTYDNSWKNYVRLEATKVFIEVTDDDSDMTSAAFDNALLAKAPAGMFGTKAKRNYIFHSIVSKPFAAAVPSTAICNGAAGQSVHYQNLSVLTGGIIDEVCKTDYSAVLNNIAKGITDKLGCEVGYPSSAEADPTKVAVTFTPKGGAAQTLTQVTDVSKCGSVANAWYYDDPAKPTKIVLCPSMCGTANASTDGKLEALVGCKAAPPK